MKRVLSLLLVLVVLVTALPVWNVEAAEAVGFQFMEAVTYELPVVVPGQLINSGVTLPEPREDGFLLEPSAAMPEIRSDGFLAEPSAPMPEFPTEGGLMEEPGAPDPAATPISNAKELAQISSGGNYVLTADIDLSGSGWAACNVYGALTLDGQGHVISGLTTSGSGDTGLLGQVNGDLTVRNLLVRDIAHTGQAGIGIAGLAIYVGGNVLVENCSVAGFSAAGISARYSHTYCGGLIGYVAGANAEFRACSVQLQWEVPTGPYYNRFHMGGLVGELSAGQAAFTDCAAEVTAALPEGVAAEEALPYIDFGGLVGDISSDGGSYSFLRCRADVEVGKGTFHTGGMVGVIDTYSADVQFRDCAVTGQLVHAPGMLLGSAKGSSVELINCTARGSIVSEVTEDSEFNYVGMVGIAGEDRYDCIPALTFRHCLNEADYSLSGSSWQDGRYVYLTIGGLAGLACGPVTMEDCLNTGRLNHEKRENAQVVCGGLAGLIGIDTTRANNTTVYPISITRSENRADLSVECPSLGGLVGMAQTASVMELSDCKNTGDLSSTYEAAGSYAYVGGLIGSGNAILDNCVNSGDIVSDDYAGGLVGYCSVISYYNPYTISIHDCSSTGSITSLTSASIYGVTGGLSAAAVTDCENCYVRAQELSGWKVYGLANKADRIDNCYVEAALTVQGGSAAGLTGSAETAVNSYAAVTIRQTADKSAVLGGLIEKHATLRNCAAHAEISIPDSVSDTTTYIVGGLVGGGEDETITMSHCYATGSIDVSAAKSTVLTKEQDSWVGGLVGCGQGSIGHSWSDMELRGGECQGGLLGFASGDTYIFGSYSDSRLHSFSGQRVVGGLVGGQADTFSMQDCTFRGTISSLAAEVAGGLLGGRYETAHTTSSVSAVIGFRNCYVEGDLISTASKACTVGGLAGTGGGSFTDCRFRGNVRASGGSSGGIAGRGKEFINCQASGSVSNAHVGGIAGYGTLFRDCVSDVKLGTCAQTYACTSHEVGGIAGNSGGNIVDCTVLQRITLREDVSVYAGGAAGYFTGDVIDGTTTKGVSVTVSGRNVGHVGGILGNYYGYILYDEYLVVRDCTVDGGVMGRGVDGIMRVGGILGKADGEAFCLGCTVDGSVTGSINVNSDRHKRECYVATGGVGGETEEIMSVEGFTCTGAIIFPRVEDDEDEEYRRSWHVTKYLGKGPVSEYAPVEVPPVERPVENYTFMVKGIDVRQINLYPLGGVQVYIDGTYIGSSAADGSLRFNSDQFRGTNLVEIVAQKVGYFQYYASTYFGLEDERLLILKEKEDDKFYISSVEYIDEEGKHTDLLNGLNSVKVPITEENSQRLLVNIDWNGAVPDSQYVYLGDSAGNFEEEIIDGTVNSVFLQKKFELKEDIYLYAQAKFEGKAETVKEKKKLSVSVGLGDIKLPVPYGKADIGGAGDQEDDKFLYFLQGVNMNAGFGDLGPFAASVSVKNNYVKLKFGAVAEEEDKVPLFKNGKATVAGTLSINGEVGFPLYDPDAQWTGGVVGKINDEFSVGSTDTASVKLKNSMPSNSILSVTYPFQVPTPVGPIPCILNTKLGMGGRFNLGAKGPYDKAYFNGTIGVSGYGSIFAGPGVMAGKPFEVAFGGEASMKASADIGYDQLENPKDVDVDALFEGALNLKAYIKAHEASLEGKLRLGYYKWDEVNGAEWSLFGFGSDDQKALSLQSDDLQWTPMERAASGMFLQDTVSLLDDAGSISEVRYSNVGANSEGALGYENGQPVLYFTADDGQASGGTAAAHTVLYRSVQSADGSWSAPVVISDGGYPAIPQAEKHAVIWVESTDTADLEGLLRSTNIKVALNGVLSATFPGNGYVYGPNVSVSGSTVMVSWLSDPELDGQTAAYYATYDGSAWSDVMQISTGDAQPVAVYPSAYGSAAYVRTDANEVDFGPGSITEAGAMGSCDQIFASIDEDGLLRLFVCNTLKASVQTQYAATRNPVVTGDSEAGTYYVVWQEIDSVRYVYTKDGGETWSQPMTLCAAEQIPAGLSAACTETGLLVSYYLTTEEGTDLLTAAVKADSADLVVGDVTLQMEGFLKTGVLQTAIPVFNNGLGEAEGYQVTIADETGKEVSVNQFPEKSIGAGTETTLYVEFAPDGVSGHTYQITVMPLTAQEADPADNAGTVELPGGQAALLDANFAADETGAVSLEAYARNEGGAPLAQMRMEVTDPDGTVLAEEIFETVSMGSVRKLQYDCVAPGIYYTVTIYADGEPVEQTMLLYEDPDAKSLVVTSAEISETAQVTLTMDGQNLETGAQLIFALYQEGQMRHCAMGTAATLNGVNTVSMALSEEPGSGTYSYRLFVLSDDGSFCPLHTPCTGTVTVG